jgi:hypothetical protein
MHKYTKASSCSVTLLKRRTFDVHTKVYYECIMLYYSGGMREQEKTDKKEVKSDYRTT